MKPLHVHLYRSFDEESLQVFEKELSPNIHYTRGQELPKEPMYQVLVAGRPPQAFLEASPHLRTVVIPWAGLSTKTRKILREYPHLAVHNLHHNADATAEIALALLFAAAKEILPFDRALRDHDWRPRYRPSETVLLQGKTALILGYGRIGQRVGRVLEALGAKVLAIRRNPAATPEGKVEIHPPHALPSLLPRANILLLTLPLTHQTRDLIGAEELALLPDHAILVNVARGPIVNQKALYHALKSGKLHGAAADVWYHYPKEEESRAHTPPADYPFHEVENMVMSPHRAGHVQETEILRATHLAKLLNEIAAGDEVSNPVNLEVGY